MLYHAAVGTYAVGSTQASASITHLYTASMPALLPAILHQPLPHIKALSRQSNMAVQGDAGMFFVNF